MNTKKKLGRPRLSPQDAKSTQVNIRLTPSCKKALAEKAKSENCTVSELINIAIAEKIGGFICTQKQ